MLKIFFLKMEDPLQEEGGPFSPGTWGDLVFRRGERDVARHAGKTPQSASGERHHPRRRRRGHEGGCQDYRCRQ